MSSFSGRPPSRTAFIGNLPFGVTEELLMDICSEAGPVKFFRLVSDAKTGDPKGFAFCEYFDVASVQNAIRLLNNREVMGRKIRIDYGTDQATTGMEGKPGVIRQIGSSQAVGMDAAKMAAQNMQMLLPGGAQASALPAHPDTVTSIIAGMSRPELYAIISQVKTLIQQDPKQVRELLTAQPNLARALFQAQVALGMLPLPQTNGGMSHAAGPSPHHPQQPTPVMPPQQQQQQPAPHLQHMPQGQSHAMAGTSAGYGAGGMMPFQRPGQQQMAPGPPQVSDPRTDPRTDPRRSFQQQPQQQPGAEAPQYQQGFPGPQGHQPSQQQNPQGFGQAPQQQQQPQPSTQAQQPQQPQQQPQQPQFGLAQQQALLQQVMNLTPQQIELLPEQQKLQVLTLQKQMRGQSS